MSVIPLKDIDTVVDTKLAFDGAGGLRGPVIFIQNIEKDQLNAPLEANATYDLRVGPEYRLLHNPEKSDLPDGGEITLRRGESVLIQTEEYVYLPKTVFGIVLSKVSIVQQGASNDASKVDPGYSGSLIVTVTNFGREPVVLKRKQKFCSIVFLRMESEAKAYEKVEKRIFGTGKRRFRHSIVDMIESHNVIITILHSSITILLIMLVIYLTINRR